MYTLSLAYEGCAHRQDTIIDPFYEHWLQQLKIDGNVRTCQCIYIPRMTSSMGVHFGLQSKKANMVRWLTSTIASECFSFSLAILQSPIPVSSFHFFCSFPPFSVSVALCIMELRHSYMPCPGLKFLTMQNLAKPHPQSVWIVCDGDYDSHCLWSICECSERRGRPADSGCRQSVPGSSRGITTWCQSAYSSSL